MTTTAHKAAGAAAPGNGQGQQTTEEAKPKAKRGGNRKPEGQTQVRFWIKDAEAAILTRAAEEDYRDLNTFCGLIARKKAAQLASDKADISS